MTNALLAILQALEVELHHPGVRCDAQRLAQLLHTDFHEVGRSGRQYDRVTVMRFLGEQVASPPVISDHFALQQLGSQIALLTYRSALRRPDATLENHTLRSSVWVQQDARWQLIYHQGTPAAELW
ncbi:nuclear transport factor 2 family protein [Acidovorax sp. LjRoot118]|uniref:nuclear transport factor 2 family protein n=1 Tax=unclassified Acidovorax TaxID=2684926 RepID=UPI003ECED6CC